MGLGVGLFFGGVWVLSGFWSAVGAVLCGGVGLWLGHLADEANAGRWDFRGAYRKLMRRDA